VPPFFTPASYPDFILAADPPAGRPGTHSAAMCRYFSPGLVSRPHPSGALSPSKIDENNSAFQMDFLWNFSRAKTGRPNENRDQIAGSKTSGTMPPLP
jgi:hypothetical protein